MFPLLLVLSLLIAASPVQAQPNSQLPPDMLMQLMQSQLPVDINSPVTAEVVVDPPVIGVGDKAVYRLRLNALEAAIRGMPKLPVPAGLEVTPSAQGQVLQPQGTMLRPLTAINFHLRATRPGLFTIPAFMIEVYGKPVRVPEARVEVAPRLEADEERARELVVLPLRTNVYLGESLRVRIGAPSTVSNVVENLMQVQFNGEGFLGDKAILSQTIQPFEARGRRWLTRMLEMSVTPIAVGQQKLSAQAFTVGWQSVGPVVLSGQATIRLGGAMQYVLLDSEPVTLNVQPLPPEETTQGFTGFIGPVVREQPLLSTNMLRVGDAIRLLVTFRGPENLSRLTPPPAPRVSGWQTFPAMPAESPPLLRPMPGLNYIASYAYTLIPTSEEARETPAIPFSVFDPDKAEYVDLTIPPVKVTVSADGLPTDWKPAAWAEAAPTERKPTLSPPTDKPGRRVASLVPVQLRAWFIPLQLAPALVLFGLWQWDRRRRFLEAHPEIVRRRAARKALRRERRAMRQAAACGDAPGFVARAVQAMQVAAAPHFPAEPRALVCGEVLSLFPEPDRTGQTGEIIRSFFHSGERQQFAPKNGNEMPMFDRRPELEAILESMEARL